MDTNATSNMPVEEVPSSLQDDFTTYFDDLKKKTFEFSEAKKDLKLIVDDWSNEIKETEERRKTRDVDIDVRGLRAEHQLDEDETLIPVRVIDTNIQREMPPYVNYIKNSRRLIIFSCISDPDQNDNQALELDFTRGMTYPSWEIPHYKNLDGTATHGWDSVEVIYDESKPLHCGIEHLGHDNLLFPRTCLDIQDAGRIIRVYDVTILQLKKFVDKFGFSKDQVGKIISARKNGQKESETLKIYKEFCKYDGQVYVAWFALEYGTDDWLRAPAPLYLGINNKVTKMVDVPTTVVNPLTGLPEQTLTKQPQESWEDAPVTQYPVYILPYRESEKKKITDKKGRCFLDKYKQEAQTAITSSFVNGLYRATQVYAARGQEDGTGSSLQEEQDIILTGNRILNKPITFFHPDYPDPMVLKALQYFDVANAAETNQVSFAANNRQDSRKTAKEIESAESQQSLLNSVQLTLFSTYIRNVYSLCWLIVQSQALQGKVKLLQIKKQKPKLNPVTGTPLPDPTTGQPIMEDYYENDFERIKQIYDIRSAGDVDIIQKEEIVSKMKQDWPVVSTTVLRDTFLAELIRLSYPDKGEQWANILLTQGNQFNQTKQLLNGFSQIITAIFKEHPELVKTLAPQEVNAVQQMIQQSQQLSAMPAQ